MAIRDVYIAELKIDRYKSLIKTQISLSNGINFIIGKNGAGKSNLLEFVYSIASRNFFSNRRVLPRVFNTNFSLVVGYNEDELQGFLKLRIRRIASLEPEPNSLKKYELSFSQSLGGKVTVRNQKIMLGQDFTRRDLREKYYKEVQILRLLSRTFVAFQYPKESNWLSKPAKFTIDEDAGVNFEENAYDFNLITSLEMEMEFEFFETIQKGKKTSNELLKRKINNYINSFIEKKGINSLLTQFTPIEQIRINPNLNIYNNDDFTIVENLTFDFLMHGSWMPWSYLSDGTKRLFYLITEIAISPKNGLVLVEEPEIGVHPHQLFKILEFLKEQSYYKQVIISTHSPQALDILGVDELSRINIAKMEKGTRFSKMTKAQMMKATKYMTELGDLSAYWLNSDLEK